MLEHERGLEPQHAITEPSQRPIPTRIGGATVGMIAAIDFHDQPNPDGGKIGNEAPNGHLPPKPDPELLVAKQRPEGLLRRRER